MSLLITPTHAVAGFETVAVPSPFGSQAQSTPLSHPSPRSPLQLLTPSVCLYIYLYVCPCLHEECYLSLHVASERWYVLQ